MSPSTRLTPLLSVALLAGGVLLLAACGEPPQPLPTSPPFSALPSGQPSGAAPSADAPTATGAPGPTGVVPTPAYPGGGYPGGGYPGGGYPAYTPPAAATTTTKAATTNSPTPTPSHAPKCSGTTQPAAAQVLALIKGKKGIPKETLKVFDGPYCAEDWSFALIGVASKAQSKQDPLFVVTVGPGSSLQLVTAGSDVCNDPVQNDAPAGIRVMACGF